MKSFAAFYAPYTHVPSNPPPSGWVSIRCCLHEDKEASAGFDVNTGYYKCFRCGAMSPEAFLVKLGEFSSIVEASAFVDNYRKVHELTEVTNTFSHALVFDPRWHDMWRRSVSAVEDALEKREGEVFEFLMEYIESRGLSESVIRKAAIGFLPKEETSWSRDSLVFAYTLGGKVVGLRYRDRSGNKHGEKGTHFCLWGLDELEGKTAAILCEGESDRLRTMAVLEECGESMAHVGVVSTPTGDFRAEWVRDFEGVQKIYSVAQADETAGEMVKKCQTFLGARHEAVTLPWRRAEYGKDVCHWMVTRTAAEFLDVLGIYGVDRVSAFMSGAEFAKIATREDSPLIHKLFNRREIGILAGPPKNRKTWLALNMIRAFVYGEEFLGMPGVKGVGGKVLFIEEEGNEADFCDRLDKVFGGQQWHRDVRVGFRLGVNLDDPWWRESLVKEVRRNQIDLVVADPFQKMTRGDENSAEEMAKPWHTLQDLTNRCARTGVLLLHHFGKTGTVEAGWNALRGSSRLAGEADLGMFLEKDGRTGGNVMALDGRSLRPFDFMPEDMMLYHLGWDEDTGMLTWLPPGSIDVAGGRGRKATKEEREAFLQTLDEWFATSNEVVRLRDVCEASTISQPAARRWIEQSGRFIIAQGFIHPKR